MKQLNDKIITWIKHHNIDKLEPNMQYLKIIEEVGELARGLLKNDLEAIKDAIGDIYVALVGYGLQTGLNFYVREQIEEYDDIVAIKCVISFLDHDDSLIVYIPTELSVIAHNNNLTLYECVSHAYNEIKDREIKIKNGVAVKNEN